MNRLLVALLAVVLAGLSGCLTNGSDGPDGDTGLNGNRLTTEEWTALLSEPRFDSYTETIHELTAEDGTSLILSLYLPNGIAASETLPTLIEYTPYQTLDRGPGAVLGGSDLAGDGWSEVILRGAAFVRADERGGHSSGGCLDFGGTADRADALTFNTWIRGQPWSNGIIVSDGVSHPGMGSVVAHVADPNLTAAIAVAPVVSYYQDEWLQGAKFEDQLNGYAYQAIDLAPTTDPTNAAAVANQVAPCHGQMVVDYAPIDGEFSPLWQDRDLALQIENGNIAPSTTPILLAHGFADVNVHTDHSQLYWDALPDDANKFAIFGWWAHQWPVMEDHPADNYADWRHRWMDATLFGIDNGVLDEPRVLVEDSTGTWHESHNWPIDNSEALTFFPDATGGTLSTAPPETDARVDYLDDVNTRRHDWIGSTLFTTAPLESARLVNGAPELTLVATSSHEATKWVAILNDVAPDGSRARISHGYADSHRLDPRADSWAAIIPGTPATWTIPLLPTAVIVEAGHRIELIITSQDSRNNNPSGSPCYDGYDNGCYSPSGILPATSIGMAVNTVFTGAEGTFLELAWIDPSTTSKPVSNAE